MWSQECSLSYDDSVALGDLVDVSDEVFGTLASDLGLKYPLALSREAFCRTVVKCPTPISSVAVLENFSKNLPPCQDWRGRLWDVLSLFRLSALNTRESDTEMFFSISVFEGEQRETIALKAVSGPKGFDDPSPCVIVTLADR